MASWLGLFFMSEYVDDLLAACGYPDDGMGQSEPAEYMTLSDEELRKECAAARDAKTVSIRNWPHKLSEKQRWCLAIWCAKRDEREMQRALGPNTKISHGA